MSPPPELRVTEGGSGLQVRNLAKSYRKRPVLRDVSLTLRRSEVAALLGPLVVAPEYAGQGYGRALVGEAMDVTRAAGLKLVVLVGDESYYGRYGFKPVPPGAIMLPGPANPARILAAEHEPGALAAYRGVISGR